MSIVITSNVRYASASTVPFQYTTLWSEKLANIVVAMNSLSNSGDAVRNVVLSDDRLTCTWSVTFRDFQALSSFQTIKEPYFDHVFRNEYASGNLVSFSTSINGITQPFTETIVYSFPTEHDALQVELRTFLESRENLTTVSNTSTSITAVYSYSGQDQYNTVTGDSVSIAKPLLAELVATGVTRTRTFTA